MLGEANYRKFVASYKPDGLIVGGASGVVVGRWTGVARFGCVILRPVLRVCLTLPHTHHLHHF